MLSRREEEVVGLVLPLGVDVGVEGEVEWKRKVVETFLADERATASIILRWVGAGGREEGSGLFSSN